MVLTILYKIYKSAAGLLEGDEGEIMEEEPTCIHRNLHFTGVPDNEMALQIQKGTGPTPLPYHGMQATLAATNFSPKSVPSLYPQLAKSQKNLHRKDSFVPKPPKVQETTSDNGDDQRQRQAYRKSSIKNFGSLFARNRSSIASTSPLTQVMSSESEGRDTSVETERASQQTTLVSSDIPSPSNIMTVTEREKIRERHRKFVKLQGLGHDHPTVFTADPGDYSQYDYDDSVDNRRFRDECGECEGTHVAHDLASPTPSSRHRRNESLHVNLSPEEVKKYADEVRNMTIADVHLSLFGYWIKESDKHFQEAKKYLRELGLDRVSLKHLLCI
ncbi:uncharacterized protein J4E87_006247 [Alternaria ethzedia]|uniref:uncharacterized protein n=1 Tax=Alternaria ethzedia TaxID=181014 RepID=UPI0020C2D7AD|nr:uncharacterized protein J4E87_006247 [Alternaria ethzedia]KAI4622680.1 hypothetical protein J4E87_006247 [Alternaria ethzedia]